MRLLVTGALGQLGRALATSCRQRSLPFLGIDLPEHDITDAATVQSLVGAFRPQVIVNCAAFTAVDLAEEREEEAHRVNAVAVAHLAKAANQVGSILVQVSTDYVFDGTAQRPYREEDSCRPLSAYGRTKFAGELAAQQAERHLIVRTAWLYGEGQNFVGAIRRQLHAGVTPLRVVADQYGCPTFAGDLAETIVRLASLEVRGVLHVVNDGVTSWHGFACEIVRQLGAATEVVPVTTAEVPRRARRPAWSVLDTTRLCTILGRVMPPWQDALARYLRTARG